MRISMTKNLLTLACLGRGQILWDIGVPFVSSFCAFVCTFVAFLSRFMCLFLIAFSLLIHTAEVLWRDDPSTQHSETNIERVRTCKTTVVVKGYSQDSTGAQPLPCSGGFYIVSNFYIVLLFFVVDALLSYEVISSCWFYHLILNLAMEAINSSFGWFVKTALVRYQPLPCWHCSLLSPGLNELNIVRHFHPCVVDRLFLLYWLKCQ